MHSACQLGTQFHFSSKQVPWCPSGAGIEGGHTDRPSPTAARISPNIPAAGVPLGVIVCLYLLRQEIHVVFTLVDLVEVQTDAQCATHESMLALPISSELKHQLPNVIVA